MKKIVYFIAGAAVLAVLVLFAAKNTIIKAQVEKVVARETGFRVTIGTLDVALFKHTITVKDMILSNPTDFPENEAMTLNKLLIDYDLPSLLFGKQPHFYAVVLDIGKISVVEKADGETNLERLTADIQRASKRQPSAQKQQASSQKQLAPETADQTKPASPRPGTPEPRRDPFLIDNLTLAIGDVQYIQYETNNDTPEVNRIEFNRETTYRQVTSIEQIAMNIATQVALNKGVQELSKWARDNKDDLGINDEDIDKATQFVGGLLNALNSQDKKTSPKND